jgi:AcrR family transcriptional regulator
MTDLEFDLALVDAALALAAERGWAKTGVAEAARRAGLKLERARERFPSRAHILLRLGVQADRTAVAGITDDGTARDRLFDALMRRFDHLQARRAGVLAVLDGLPADPCTALLLVPPSLASMAWILDACGVSSAGLRGMARAKGLWAVWLYTANAWRKDDSPDLTATMSALDRALTRAEQAAGWIGDRPAQAASAG